MKIPFLFLGVVALLAVGAIFIFQGGFHVPAREVMAAAGEPEARLSRHEEAVRELQDGRISARHARQRKWKASSVQSNVLFAEDPRLVALSPAEIGWMSSHYYPTQSDLDSLDKLDIDSLKGTRDPRLATLQGLALIRRGNVPGALAVLQVAASMGSIYAYQEAAVAEYRLMNERLGASQDNDDVLRAHLEVATILGDYRSEYLVSKYLPNYDVVAHAAAVQRHTSEFLRQLGANAQLMEVPMPGPDPRPNRDQWIDLKQLHDRGEPPTSIDTYLAE